MNIKFWLISSLTTISNIVEHNNYRTKKNLHFTLIKSFFDLIERSLKQRRTQTILIVEERIVERHTCFG